MAQKGRWQAVIVGLFTLSALLTGLILGAHSFSPTTGQPALYLTADPSEIQVGGIDQAMVNATVWDGERWIRSGPVVNFSTDLGNITASAPIENGTATAILTAGTEPDWATITAEIYIEGFGLVTNTTIVSFYESKPPLPPKLPYMVLTADPSEIVADGIATATINASVWVWEEDLERYCLIWLWPGQVVNFSTDLGTVTESSQIINGTATATLTAGTTPGMATVMA